MKAYGKIISKICIISLFLYITPFFDGFFAIFSETQDLMSHFVYKQQIVNEDIELKERLNVLSYNVNLTLPKEEITIETTKEDPVSVPSAVKEDDKKVTSTEKNGKKIYIYNTHQDEGYKGGKTVMDGAAILGKNLEDLGYRVVLETNDFGKYLRTNGLTYNDSYVVSSVYLMDALVNYGGFDLCIDFHRDSIPRNVSYIDIGNTRYAKAMMVVGGLGENADSAKKISQKITDQVNKYGNGIMKSVMVREAYYNQEIHENIILIEVGGDVNTFEEVQSTVNILAKGIDEMMKEEQE